MRRVIVESPFKGRGAESWPMVQDHYLNLAYAKALCRALAMRGDAPYASHLLLTQFLADHDDRERALGTEAGLVWGVCAQLTVVGIDRGLTEGMRQGIARAILDGRPVELVTLGSEWRAPEHEISHELWAAVAGVSSITVLGS